MDRVFEYAAMRAMAENITKFIVNNKGSLPCIADGLMEYAGLVVEELQRNAYVVSPNSSRRLNPACLIVVDKHVEAWGWKSMLIVEGMKCYVFEAGEYRVASKSKAASVRTAEEDPALRPFCVSLHKQLT